MELKTENSNTFSLLIAINILGIMNALKKGKLTTYAAHDFLLNPYMFEKIKENKCDKKVIHAFDLCLELDCVSRQYPEIYSKSILEIENILISFLSESNIPNEIFIR